MKNWALTVATVCERLLLPLMNFLSTLLLKEQSVISGKRTSSSNKCKHVQLFKLASCSNFPAKSPVLQRQRLKVVLFKVKNDYRSKFSNLSNWKEEA